VYYILGGEGKKLSWRGGTRRLQQQEEEEGVGVGVVVVLVVKCLTIL
jgi:hypothetical protein